MVFGKINEVLDLAKKSGEQAMVEEVLNIKEELLSI
jgi:hypothetical protein